MADGSGSAQQCPAADMIAFLAGLPLVSRPIISRWFRQDPATETKHDASPVTIADRDVETALKTAVAARFPKDNLAGEEFGATPETGSAFRWIIDPIDGTKAFVSGKPVFGTLVGLLYNDMPVAGLVDMPMLEETYIGLNGFGGTIGAWLNDRPIVPRRCTDLAAARLATTSPRALSPERRPDFDKLADRVAVTNYGGDCHNYALLAAGHIDIVMEDSLAPHDIMAVVALCLGAGASVTDLAGAPVTFGRTTSLLVAATPDLHAAARAVISGASKRK